MLLIHNKTTHNKTAEKSLSGNDEQELSNVNDGEENAEKSISESSSLPKYEESIGIVVETKPQLPGTDEVTDLELLEVSDLESRSSREQVGILELGSIKGSSVATPEDTSPETEPENLGHKKSHFNTGQSTTLAESAENSGTSIQAASKRPANDRPRDI